MADPVRDMLVRLVDLLEGFDLGVTCPEDPDGAHHVGCGCDRDPAVEELAGLYDEALRVLADPVGRLEAGKAARVAGPSVAELEATIRRQQDELAGAVHAMQVAYLFDVEAGRTSADLHRWLAEHAVVPPAGVSCFAWRFRVPALEAADA